MNRESIKSLQAEAAQLTPWRDVAVYDAEGRRLKGEAHQRAMAEFRDAGEVWGHWLADPAQYDADGEPLSGEGANLVDAGPDRDAIDWTGIDDEEEELAWAPRLGDIVARIRALRRCAVPATRLGRLRAIEREALEAWLSERASRGSKAASEALAMLGAS